MVECLFVCKTACLVAVQSAVFDCVRPLTCNQTGRRRCCAQDVDTSGPQSEVTMHVADRAMGAVIGKGGEVINQLKSVVGVRIRVSGREEFVEGTRDRTITISGPVGAVGIAQKLIEQKVAAASVS